MSRPPVAQQLVEKTISIVEEGGEVALRIRDLVAETGIALATIYKYFGNREGLLDSAYAEMFYRTSIHPFGEFRTAIEKCDSAEDFAAVIVGFFNMQNSPEALQRRRTRIAVLGSAQARPSLASKLADMTVQYTEAFSDILRGPQEKGWISNEFDLRTIAVWFMGYVNNRAPMDLRQSDWDLEAMNRLYNQTVLNTFLKKS